MPVRRWVAHGAFAALASGFVALAIHRRLNFDEALALRSGWLELARFDAEPAFVMPWTLLVGGIGRSVADPGVVFLVARLLAVLGVLGALWFALARIGFAGARSAAVGLLVLGQGSFVAHGLEFRYDAAIVASLLVLFGAIAPTGRERPGLAGVAVGLLALHHLKGLSFALALGVWCVARLRRRSGDLSRFAAGAAATVGLWLVVLAASGLAGRWMETLGGFWALASGATRVSPVEALGPAMVRDLGWWVVVSIGLVLALLARRREPGSEEEGAAIAFMAVTLGFAVLHPHPWNYMLALPAPFLAIIVVGRWPSQGFRSRLGRRWTVAVLSALAIQFGLGGGSPWLHWSAAIDAPRAPIVATLRALRAAAAPEDRVLDPSGLAYFLRPCTRQWYVDTLFAEGVARGTWMSELGAGIPVECKWVLTTYRLGSLPGPALTDLSRRYVRLRAGVGVRATDSAALSGQPLAKMAEVEIESYW